MNAVDALRLSDYPSHTNLRNRFRQVCGQHVGILESQLLLSARPANFPISKVCTNLMPAYHKLLIHEKAEMSYHLSGYGMYHEEALIRLLGEGIERYALLAASTLYQKNIIYASYNQVKNEGTVVPWEYMKIYSDLDYAKFQARKTNIQNITPHDVLGWLRCPSIFEAGKEILIPAQMLFTGYRTNAEVKEKRFIPGFSKGSAAHTSIKKALKSAILESIEADAEMIQWYTSQKARRVIIDETTPLEIVSELLGQSDYEILPCEFSLSGMPAHTFGVALLNKRDRRPFCAVGCQASLEPAKGLYRAVLEAMGCLYLANYGPLIMPEDYLVSAGDKGYTNLDSNVALWALPREIEQKKSLIYGLAEGEVALSSLKDLSADDDEELKYLLNGMRSVSQYGVFLDVTPVEVAGMGWTVIRTFFPELVQMSLPDFPYRSHQRILQYGGVTNDFPHPLA